MLTHPLLSIPAFTDVLCGQSPEEKKSHGPVLDGSDRQLGLKLNGIVERLEGLTEPFEPRHDSFLPNEAAVRTLFDLCCERVLRALREATFKSERQFRCNIWPEMTTKLGTRSKTAKGDYVAFCPGSPDDKLRTITCFEAKAGQYGVLWHVNHATLSALSQLWSSMADHMQAQRNPGRSRVMFGLLFDSTVMVPVAATEPHGGLYVPDTGIEWLIWHRSTPDNEGHYKPTLEGLYALAWILARAGGGLVSPY